MKRWAWTGLVSVLLASSSAAAADYVNDPLTEASFPGRGSKGGTFSSNGWTTVDEPDALWYEIADALPTGHIEFTVTGISLTSLTGADHDIFAMYQAPTGQAEPVPYSPYFRNNDFKAFTRIFGVQEPGRAGAMKLEIAFCPRGDPWHHDFACDPSCDKGAIAYANGTDKDVGWDGATAYTIAIDWSPGTMSFSRNGTNLGTVNFDGEYAPKPLRVRIGSPRHDGIYPGVAMMPKGLTFKDLKISGTAGNMTPLCGGTVEPDAGSSGGAPGQDSGSSSNEYSVLADVTAAEWESGVYSVVNDLNIEGDGSKPTAVVYLRFPAVTGTVEKAVLKLRTGSAGEAAGASGIICTVADDTWQETTMTWANRPAVGTTCAGSPFSVDPDTDYEWDVTSLAQSGKNINLAVVSNDSNGAHYLSKEASPTQGPRLSIVSNGSSGSGGSGATGSGGAWSDSGIPGAGKGGSGAAGGSKAGGGTTEDEGGCGCRVGQNTRASLAMTAIGLLAWGLVMSRRRKRN